jgi:hypothetical protein
MLGFAGPSSFTHYETRRNVLTVDIFLKLCDIYGVSPIWVLTGRNPFMNEAAYRRFVEKTTLAAEDLQRIHDLLIMLDYDGLSTIPSACG